MPQRTKQVLEDEDLVERTRERYDRLFEEYDDIYLAFSSGKDSGLLLNMAIEAWHRHDDWDDPIYLTHIDPEFHYPESMDYFERVIANNPEAVHMLWFAVPAVQPKLTNDYDGEEYRYFFDERHADKWVRDIPTWDDYDNADLIRPDHPHLKDDFKLGWAYSDTVNHWISKETPATEQETIQLIGLRAEESMMRYNTIIQKGGWIRHGADDDPQPDSGWPVYDWSAEDLWTAHHKFDWDYSEVYDKMHQMGDPPTKSRNGPPWHGPGISNRTAYEKVRHMWPELYEKAEHRYEGCVLSFEFGGDLYVPKKPDGETWREHTARLVNSMDDESEAERVAGVIEDRLDRHHEKTGMSLHEKEECPMCGYSWRSMAQYVYNRKKGIQPGGH